MISSFLHSSVSQFKLMETCRLRFQCSCFCVFLLLLCAEANYDPLNNVNLAPFWQWRSVWECMQNSSDYCKTKNEVLKLDGVLNINGTEIEKFCKGGCADHTKEVLNCMFYAKRDLKFGNGASVHNISQTIHDGCISNSRINTNFTSSGIRACQNLLVPTVASLATMLIVNIFM